MLGWAEMRGRTADVSGERHAEAADGLISACEGDLRDGDALPDHFLGERHSPSQQILYLTCKIPRLSERYRRLPVRSGWEDAKCPILVRSSATRQEPEARELELADLSGRVQCDPRGGLTGGSSVSAVEILSQINQRRRLKRPPGLKAASIASQP